MKLNHLDLQVQDVATTKAFFERYFGLRTQSNPNSPALVIMKDEGGFVLVLQRARAPHRYPEGFHLGFSVADLASVHTLHARALADGTQVSDVLVNGRGAVIYLTAPEGYYVEVTCPPRPPAPIAAA